MAFWRASTRDESHTEPSFCSRGHLVEAELPVADARSRACSGPGGGLAGNCDGHGEDLDRRQP